LAKESVVARDRRDDQQPNRGKSSQPRSWSRSSGRPATGGRPATSRGSGRATKPTTDRRDGRDQRRGRDRQQPVERTVSQAEYDGPPIPDDITGRELQRSAANQLKSLPEKLANRVARHLVAAARLIDTDPEAAYAHTVAARARAARVAVVREASGESAYAAGRFKDALAELKAARRLSGDPIYLPMMADCERALGRPDRALALARDPAVEQLDEAGQVEMLIVASGARRDQGDVATAIRTLDVPELRSRSRAPWSPRIRYAYAEALLADGQVQQAREWFERAAGLDPGLDPDGVTDAEERVSELAERLDGPPDR
jgi:tetratricopeptide (TPR) repeat protein